MGDYFDDDDLINDYMEEDFEPPPEYDEAFDESELVDSKSEKVDSKREKVDKNTPMKAWIPMEDPSLQDPVEEEEGGAYWMVPSTVHVMKPERKTDVYSFER